MKSIVKQYSDCERCGELIHGGHGTAKLFDDNWYCFNCLVIMADNFIKNERK